MNRHYFCYDSVSMGQFMSYKYNGCTFCLLCNIVHLKNHHDHDSWPSDGNFRNCPWRSDVKIQVSLLSEIIESPTFIGNESNVFKDKKKTIQNICRLKLRMCMLNRLSRDLKYSILQFSYEYLKRITYITSYLTAWCHVGSKAISTYYITIISYLWVTMMFLMTIRMW